MAASAQLLTALGEIVAGGDQRGSIQPGLPLALGADMFLSVLCEFQKLHQRRDFKSECGAVQARQARQAKMTNRRLSATDSERSGV